MKKYADKTVLFILCSAVYLSYKLDVYAVVPMIVTVSLSAFLTYMDTNAVTFTTYAAFCVGAVLYPQLLFFIPLLCYDVYLSGWKALALFGIIPIFLCRNELPVADLIFIPLLAGLSLMLEGRTAELEHAKIEHLSLQDKAREVNLELERRNRELMEKQDIEVNIATLNERNRIARDIHDSIGHLLSNAILQTGALMAVCPDEKTKTLLSTLKETLTEGMNSVRNSIHGLYEESVDLFTEIKALTDSFDFCEIALDYDIDGNPDKNVKYALLFILREALSNVIKHSDASFVSVTLREHPALYQLVVKDNGTKKGSVGDGIGLNNIEQRAMSLGGLTNFGYENGFTVFVTIPKGTSSRDVGG